MDQKPNSQATTGLLNLNNEKDKVNALDQLFEASAKYKNSAEFMSLLKFINKFPNLSPFNAFLVHMQDSVASVVLTPDQWLKHGRSVKPMSRPYIILFPFGPVRFVYNITDTERIDGKEDKLPSALIEPFQTTGKFSINILKLTIKNARKEGINYGEHSMQTGSAGYATTFNKTGFSIKVNSDYNDLIKYSTLVHELAHIYCGHLGKLKHSWWEKREGYSKDINEIEAESVSFLVCSRNGLKTSSIQYLSDYIDGEKELPGISVERILTVSNYIEKMGLTGFVSKNKTNNGPKVF